MKRFSVLFAILALTVRAASGAAQVPVAPGFADWEGLTERNHVAGRAVCPSDMRGKAVMVVMFDAARLEKDFENIAKLASRVYFTSETTSWMVYELPASGIVLLANTGKRIDGETYAGSLKAITSDKHKNARNSYRKAFAPVYNGVKFPGAPDPGSAAVYAYVLEPDASEPVWKGEITDKTVKAASEAFKKAMAKAPEWKPYLGTLSREDHPFPAVVKSLEAGKPVVPCYRQLLAAIKGRDAEKAKRAQLVYDALERTRSDLVCRITAEERRSPASAAADIAELSRFWPSSRKEIEAVERNIKKNRDAATLGRMLSRLRHLADPSFRCKNAQELKKLQSEIKRFAAAVDKLKESSDIAIQGDASILSSIIEETESSLPSKVAGK
ncbi:MAG: hypothetical protein K6F50_02975 [Kiritimatiellae bacterium]|nr:hypothetical protein [Kiritimatiellia bacterium]